MSKYTGPMHVPNKRIKKLQGAPKRAMSSFLSYSQLMRSEIRLQYPNLKNTDVSSVLAQKWHEASDEAKRPHIERELKDREKYHKDMARWKAEESDRAAASKAQMAADQITTEDTALFQASLQYATASQSTTPSLWAAMIDVNESAGFGSHSPLFDESMDGFWDTDGDGESNEISDLPHVAPALKTTHLSSSTAYSGDNSMYEDRGSKSQRLVKYAKNRKAPEFQPQSLVQASVVPTARQVEVQQKRQQQQQQYQMYQLHILNQKQKFEQCKDDPDNLSGISTAEASLGRNAEEHRGTRGISSAVSIVEGGRLHSQAQANQRMSVLDINSKFQNSAYQGTQRPSVSRPHEWPPGLYGLMNGTPSSAPGLPQYSNYGSAFNNSVQDRFLYEPHTAVQPPSIASQPFQGSGSNSSDTLSVMTKGNCTQPMRSFQFEEQDQLSVMQTLMAVHRATASKAGDCESIRSLDRMQLAQQCLGHGKSENHRGEGTGSIPTKQIEGANSVQHRAAILIDSSKCAPLSVQQQERQNQTERRQLTDRQSKQMQEMLLLQEREQVELRKEHSSSLVSASHERTSSESQKEELLQRNIIPCSIASK